MTEATPSRRLWAALLSGSVGLWLAYVVWSRQPGLQVSPFVGYLAAAAFGSAGLPMLLQARGYARAAAIPTVLLLVVLSGIGAWIGFGPGSRRCEASLGVLPFVTGELACRGVFAAGAVLTGLIALLMLRPVPKRRREPRSPAA